MSPVAETDFSIEGIYHIINVATEGQTAQWIPDRSSC